MNGITFCGSAGAITLMGRRKEMFLQGGFIVYPVEVENLLTRHPKLPTPKKLELLLDPHAPFLEIGALGARGMYDGTVHKAGVIIGVGVLAGRGGMVSVSDPARTRDVLGLSISAALNAPLRDDVHGYGIFRM